MLESDRAVFRQVLFYSNHWEIWTEWDCICSVTWQWSPSNKMFSLKEQSLFLITSSVFRNEQMLCIWISPCIHSAQCCSTYFPAELGRTSQINFETGTWLNFFPPPNRFLLQTRTYECRSKYYPKRTANVLTSGKIPIFPVLIYLSKIREWF